jgi:hypothetical protein
LFLHADSKFHSPDVCVNVREESSRRPIIRGIAEDIAGGQKSVVIGGATTSLPVR